MYYYQHSATWFGAYCVILYFMLKNYCYSV